MKIASTREFFLRKPEVLPMKVGEEVSKGGA
jgi:hypothetical protein